MPDTIVDFQRKLNEFRKDAWTLDAVDFFSLLGHRLKTLETVGTAAAAVYADQSVDGVWEALYEALADAGLPTSEDDDA